MIKMILKAGDAGWNWGGMVGGIAVGQISSLYKGYAWKIFVLYDISTIKSKSNFNLKPWL
jgi:hypothetical protein